MYQVKLKRITNPDVLDKVVAEIVKSSGASADKVKESLSSQAWTSIGKQFDRAKAKELRSTYEPLGAVVQALDLDDLDEEDEDDEDGRILTQEEYVKALNSRADIFKVEEETKTTRWIFPILFVIGIFLSYYLAVVFKIENIAADFYEKHIKENVVQLTDMIDLTKNLDEKKEEPKEEPKEEKKELKPKENKGSGGVSGGGGDPRARVVKKGVLGIVSGAVTGANVAGDVMGKGGYASGIDAILSGSGGLQAGGGGGRADRAYEHIRQVLHAVRRQNRAGAAHPRRYRERGAQAERGGHFQSFNKHGLRAHRKRERHGFKRRAEIFGQRYFGGLRFEIMPCGFSDKSIRQGWALR